MPKRTRKKQIPGQHHCHRCKRANVPEGYSSNGYCLPCNRKYSYARYHGPQHERLKNWWREWGRKNRKRIAVRGRRTRWLLKLETLKAYGGICACCQEARPEFLAIDHVNGGGTRHRASSGSALYAILKRQGWPKGLRVLCHNCNSALGFFGYCPHQTTRDLALQSALQTLQMSS